MSDAKNPSQADKERAREYLREVIEDAEQPVPLRSPSRLGIARIPTQRIPTRAGTPMPKKEWSQADSLTVLGILVGIFLVIVVPTLLFKIVLFFGVCVASVVLVLKSAWTSTWAVRSKLLV